MMVSEAYGKAVDLGLHRGHSKICDYDGPCVMKVDDNWTVAINGHKEPVEVPAEDGLMGLDALPPFEMAVFWNGWLAGIVGATGGTIAHGELANEDTFIAAVEGAIEKEEP